MAVDLVECCVNADSGFLKVLMDTIDKNLYYLEKETLIYKLSESEFKKSKTVQLIINHLNQKRTVVTQSIEEVEVLKEIRLFLKTCQTNVKLTKFINSIQHNLKFGHQLTFQQTEDLIWLILQRRSKERFELYNKIMSQLKETTIRVSENKQTGMFPPLHSGHYLRAIQAISRVKEVPLEELKTMLQSMKQWEIPINRQIANHLVLVFTRRDHYPEANQLILSFFEDGLLKKASNSGTDSKIEIGNEGDNKMLTRLFNTCMWSYNKMTQGTVFTSSEFHSRQRKLRELICGFLKDSEGYFDDESLYCSIEASLSGNDEPFALALLQHYGTKLERGIPITVLKMIQRKILYSLDKMKQRLTDKNLKLMDPQVTRIREACEISTFLENDDERRNGVVLASEGNIKGREEDADNSVHWIICAKLIITYMKELHYYPFPYSFQDSSNWSLSSFEIFELKTIFETQLIERQKELNLTEMDSDAMLERYSSEV
ncbi:unnamed protein product [Ambrosiozyma monospora]|uniref:Unnamed protein product n=1 Tax=Ambrosiozyma monospora TaxID=43982 RepID=A0A9W6YQ72_AMBMO|nr:unnamed protein product [Ambrosiozyma monospora]